MRCTSIVGSLAAVLLLAWPGTSSANPPEQCSYGIGSGFGLNLFSKIHQHGPLFNYGPYYGYPPFAPYGPWNAYLQYNPWYYGVPGAGGHKCFGDRGSLAGHGGLYPGGAGFGFGGGYALWGHGGWNQGCATCGHGGLFTGHGGWGHGLDGWGHGHDKGGCSGKGCGKGVSIGGEGAPGITTFNPETTNPLTRYSGAGNAADFNGYYSGLPSIDLNVAPAGGLAK